MKILTVKSDKYGEHKILIDDEDFDSINKYKWCIKKCNKSTYAHSPQYKGGGRKNKVIKNTLMHRIILGVSDLEKTIDHIDGNGLNNQKSNLRITTHQQNSFNRRIGINNRSGFMGVSFNKKTSKFMSYITYNGKKIYLGLYQSKEDAARKRDEKALELYGEFANLNFN